MEDLKIYDADLLSELDLPYADGGVRAGFPSPAQDYMDRSIDLNRELVPHPESTFYGRVEGDSMEDRGIFEGDIMVIDKSLEPRNGDVAVCMVDGEYTLTQDDLLACARFEDSIAVCNYDIDIHNPEGTGTSHYYFPEGQYYTIPYRALIPRGSENLLVAGRCISVDHEAQASIRIMPTVCCLGEAAGCAAGLAASAGCSVRDVDVDRLHELLARNNARF